MDIDGAPHRAGCLWIRSAKGRESASFKYDEDWLKLPLRFALEPALLLDNRTHHTQQGRSLFGAIGDSSPDRWGRMLLRRLERKTAKKENRQSRTLTEQDYLLNVDDRLRQGSLRFCLPGSTFLSHVSSAVPQLIQLPRLLMASDRVLTDKDTDEDLRLLIAPGSSLGGARPKAAVIDADGSLALAKFPGTEDEYSVEAWGLLALDLARKAGIAVPRHRLVTVAKRKILLTKRFDRHGSKRIPFLSAMSMIGASDHETRSYLELAEALRRYGGDVRAGLKELWKRVLFSVLISNVDDHLRNTGFLYNIEKQGWTLSPAYDLNPVPRDIKQGMLSMLIDEKDSEANFDLVMSTSEYYGLSISDARKAVEDVVAAVSGWRQGAASIGIAKSEIERMESAFEHEASADAYNFLRKKLTGPVPGNDF